MIQTLCFDLMSQRIALLKLFLKQVIELIWRLSVIKINLIIVSLVRKLESIIFLNLAKIGAQLLTLLLFGFLCRIDQYWLFCLICRKKRQAGRETELIERNTLRKDLIWVIVNFKCKTNFSNRHMYLISIYNNHKRA